MKTALVIVLVGAFSLAGCRSPAAHTIAPRPVQHQMFFDHSRPAGNLFRLPAAQIPAAVEASYRVAPDRRFLRAAADIAQIANGKEEPIDLDFVSGRWSVSIGGRPAGSLPELPTFDDGMVFLTARARAVRAATVPPVFPAPLLSSADTLIAGFYPRSLFQAAALVSKESGGKPLDGPACARMARMTSLLMLQTVDRLGMSDPLAARSLAFLAMSRSFDPSGSSEEMAILAHELGYETESKALAASLADGTIAKQWILRGAPPANPVAAKYIATSEAIHDLPTNDILPVLRQAGGVPIEAMPSFLRTHHFNNLATLGPDVAAIEENALADRATVRLRESSATRAAGFEALLVDRAPVIASSLMPSAVVASHYRSIYYSAVREEFSFLLDHLSDRQGTQIFIEHLGESRGAATGAVKVWMQDQFDLQFGRSEAGSIEKDLTTIPAIGIVARSRLLRKMIEREGPSDPAVRRATHEMFRDADSRPEELGSLGPIARDVVDDLARQEMLMRAAIDRAPDLVEWGHVALFYMEEGDVDHLWKMANDTTASTADRAAALRDLAKSESVGLRAVLPQFESLIEVDPEVFATLRPLLIEGREWAVCERIARGCLQRDPGFGIEAAFFASGLADAMEHQGRYQEAMAVIEPYISVFSFRVIAEQMSLQQRLGDTAGADRTASVLMGRYPDLSSHAAYAPVLWREGRDDEAAKLFDSSVPLTLETFRKVAPDAFMETLGDAPTAAVAAFDSLIRVGVDSQLLDSIPDAALKASKPELAFTLMERLLTLRDSDMVTQPFAARETVVAWRALKAARGEDAAMAWLQPRVPSSAAMKFLLTAYGYGEDDLVIRLSVLPVPTAQIVMRQLLLATTLVRLRRPMDDPMRIALVREVQALPDPNEAFPTCSRYLLGLIDESSFLGVGRGPDWSATAAYYIGLKDASEYRYDDGRAWILAAHEDHHSTYQSGWAEVLLNDWKNADRSWAAIKEKGVM